MDFVDQEKENEKELDDILRYVNELDYFYIKFIEGRLLVSLVNDTSFHKQVISDDFVCPPTYFECPLTKFCMPIFLRCNGKTFLVYLCKYVNNTPKVLQHIGYVHICILPFSVSK